MKNARSIWDGLCNTSVGVDREGDAVSNITTFGMVALSRGVPQEALSGYAIRPITPPEESSANNSGVMNVRLQERKKNRAAVVKFLREFADAIESEE